MNLIQKVRDTWAYRMAMREYAKAHTVCECCGAPAMLMRIRIEVHHKIPVSVAPDRAADPANMIALCASCHFVHGHLRNWRAYNGNLTGMILELRRAWVALQERILP